MILPTTRALFTIAGYYSPAGTPATVKFTTTDIAVCDFMPQMQWDTSGGSNDNISYIFHLV